MKNGNSNCGLTVHLGGGSMVVAGVLCGRAGDTLWWHGGMVAASLLLHGVAEQANGGARLGYAVASIERWLSRVGGALGRLRRAKT